MDWVTNPEAWIALASLTGLEIVLGIDNIIFIAILAGKLPIHQQRKARMIGLAAAMITRILLLFCLSMIMKLTTSLFSIFTNEISGRDMILIGGGLFLLVKSTYEIHEKMEGMEKQRKEGKEGKATSFFNVIVQIMLLDIIFSLDSVITAVGMADRLIIMVLAVIISVVFMMFSVHAVSDFVERRPTVKMLALSFLLLIGVALIADGLDFHIPKGYIYFAMAFSIFVEVLNLRVRGKGE